MSVKKVLVIGELNVDILLNDIQGFPVMGKEIIANKMNTVLGSSSAIFASNLAALGIDVTFCGTIGADANAKLILKSLEKAGVHTKYVKQIDSESTGATIILNYGEDRANVTYTGAMNSLTYDMIPWNKIPDYDHVHISNFFIQKGIRPEINKIFKYLKYYGVTTSLDMQWDVEEKWDYDFKEGLKYVDIFLPNETEILKLTGAESLNGAIRKIQPYGGKLIVKRGSSGSLGVFDDHVVECDAFQIEPFVDAIGAGDSFNSGFILKFLEGAAMEECLEMGNKIGAINTTAPGGTKAFEDQEQLKLKLNSLRKDEIKG